MSFNKKYNDFKKYLGMFVIDSSYCGVSYTLSGMDYMMDYSFLDSFQEWVCKKFNIRSPFVCFKLVEDLYHDKCLDNYKNLDQQLLLNLRNQNKTDVDFLFTLIDEFLESRSISYSAVSIANPSKE